MNSLPLSNMNLTPFDIFILLQSMVNRYEKPEIHFVAKTQLNSSVEY